LLHGQILAENGDNHSLKWRQHGRQDQSSVVTVNHNHDTNRTSGQAPRCLPWNLSGSFVILEANVKHLPKVLSKVVRSGALNGTSRNWDVGFNSGGLESSSKLFLLRLVSLDYGDRQEFLIDSPIQF
jgi:hypothetical protein